MTVERINFFEALRRLRAVETADCDVCGKFQVPTGDLTVHLKDGYWLIVCILCKHDLVHS